MPRRRGRSGGGFVLATAAWLRHLRLLRLARFGRCALVRHPCGSYEVQVRLHPIHSPVHVALEPLLHLGHNEHGRRERHQEQQIHAGQRLRLEHLLQRRKVDDQQLADHRERHRNQEELVGEQADLEDALRLRATAERIEHVEKDEARERHGGVALGAAGRAVGHLALEHPQRAQYDDAGRQQHVDDDRARDHRLLDVARLLLQHVHVDRFDAQRLGRRPVHDDVDPEDLHGIERIRDAHQRGQGDQRQRRNRCAQLEAHKVADVVEDGFALLDGGATIRKTHTHELVILTQIHWA